MQQGFIIKLVLIIIAVILIVSYFGIDIEDTANTPTAKKNFSYVTDRIVYVWDNFLKKPFKVVYDFIYIYIWEPALDGLERMRKGDAAFNIKGQTPDVAPQR
ncbi:MAG: hypothetical protein V4526_00275 [Patescibacteria group bacterium]